MTSPLMPLVARVTLRELARRRAALGLTLLLPLAFYLVRLEAHWTALRLLSMGLGWAVATLALFTQVSSRRLDQRLTIAGAEPTAIHAGHHLAILMLGGAVAVPYYALVQVTIGRDLTHPEATPLMLLLTVAVAAPLGSMVGALVPRDLEGALLLLAIMAVQLLVDPADSWTRILPLWSTRELATHIIEPTITSGTPAGAADPAGVEQHLHDGLIHAVLYALALTALSTAVTWLRLRRWPAPRPVQLPTPA